MRHSSLAASQQRRSSRADSSTVSAKRRSKRRRSTGPLIEALDRRTLLSVAFKFNIVDPTDAYKSIRSDLQRLLDTAGQEWATHLDVPTRNVTLEYDVNFDKVAQASSIIRLATGAAKSAQQIGTDPTTSLPVFRLGTVTEMLTGADPNGSKADAGIVIHAQYIKQMYFDPNLNLRNDPIPAGMIDGYTAILAEIAHTLGFVSSRDQLGNLPGSGMYGYDQHVTVFGAGFYEFGNGSFTFDPQTFQPIVDPTSDNAFKVYNGPVPLEVGNPNLLGTGRFVNEQLIDPSISLDSYLQSLQLQDDLSTDLMGGIVLPGVKKTISTLDLAILKDSGTPVSVSTDTSPEGIYTINGTGLPDTIDVSVSNGTLLVRVNDAVTSFTPTQAQNISAIIINGLAGNDHVLVHGSAPAVAINGGSGNDTLIGGDKGDSITGGGGNDLIYGGKGGDVIRGGDGKDILYGQGGSDRLFGDSGNDHLDGGAQTDREFGGSGADTVIGGTEDDFLYGDAGNDVISGAGGKDRMIGGSGADAFFGGNGNDIVDYSGSLAAVSATIDGTADDGAGEGDNINVDVENVLGSPLNDTLIGNNGPNFLIGNGGNDVVVGNGGNDTLEGDTGDDTLSGGGGNDSLLGGSGIDQLTGGSGTDVLHGDDGDDSIFANDTQVDTLDGGNGNDVATVDSIDNVTGVETPTIA